MFRWKGENVAPGEVNIAIRGCPGVLDASTYAAAVPGADGRAGMAALVVNQEFDFRIFAAPGAPAPGLCVSDLRKRSGFPHAGVHALIVRFPPTYGGY
jgi:acyl-CoA synthetase (AMP-forming)/AMP-acid ligase II